MNTRPTPETNAAKRPLGLRACADGLYVNPDKVFAQRCLRIAADRMEQLERELDEARKETIRWMSIAEGRGRTDDEEENDTQAELAAWEMLTEATRERDEARAMACDMRNQFEKESTSRLLFPWENDQANPPATHPSL